MSGSLLETPILDGFPDSLGSDIAAAHLIFGNAAQGLGNALLGNLRSLIDVLAQHHFRGNGSTRDGHGTTHTFESNLLNNLVFDPQRDQDRITVRGATYNRLGRGIRQPPDIPRIGIMGAHLVAVQEIPALD